MERIEDFIIQMDYEGESVKMEQLIRPLPPTDDIETKSILKALIRANRALAELKGLATTIPTERILITTLSLHEAKDSSSIENIMTTHDDLYKTELFGGDYDSAASKEVRRYAIALERGLDRVRKTGLITINDIIDINTTIKQNSAGIRVLPGTKIKNKKSGEVIYTPPQNHDEIMKLLGNLEVFINEDSACKLDPLVKMAVIHLQFERIHPFYDGNGRTGRILMILYLVAKGLLNIPVLYLSAYILKNKSSYYELLKKSGDVDNIEEWLLFILKGVRQTSHQTIWIIEQVKVLMQDIKMKIRTELPKIYSQDLLNNLFKHPYTTIDSLHKDIGVTRETTSKYLNLLANKNVVSKHKIGTYNYYINEPLVQIFQNIPEATD